MKKIHFSCGVIITVFTALHLYNHLYSLFGITAHIELMSDLRVIYRTRIAESILLAAIVFQMYSGIKLLLHKKKTNLFLFDRIQILTGLYLSIFLLIHLSAVLSGRYFLNLDTNFYFGVAGLNTFPLSIFFVPYYGLAIVSIFGHLAAIHSKKMKKNIFGLTPKNQAFAIIFSGLILMLLILYGLTNKFNGVDLPKEYKILTSQ